MQKINKLLASVKHEAKGKQDKSILSNVKAVIGRMTTDQLKELVYGNPSDEREKEILASVGGLHLLERR